LSESRSLTWLLAIGLVALCVAPTRAQTQLDEGKTAPQLFSSACSACHKSPRGLTKETSASTLASFLRAHYTTGREQAAVLAAFVLAAGPAAGEARGQQPGAARPDRAAEPRPPGAIESAKPAEEQGPARPTKPNGQAAQAEPQTPAGEGRRPPREEQGRTPARITAPKDQPGSKPAAPGRVQSRGADARSAAPSGAPARTDDIAD
jgi:hypothetical protein